MGWAIVMAGQPLASIVENWDADSENASAYEALFLGESNYLSTRQYKNVDNLYSQTRIVNISALPANLTAYFFNFDGTQAITITQQIASYNAINLDLKNIPNISSGFNGSLKLVSDRAIIAVTSLVGDNQPSEDRLAQFQISNILPSDFLLFTRLFKDTGGGKNSEFSFFNYGSSSTSVIITFYNQNGIEVAQITDSIPKNGIGRYSTEDISNLGDNYQGYAFVETNPIDGQLIPGETLLTIRLTRLTNYLPIIFRN
jgi:hypothetical protein